MTNNYEQFQPEVDTKFNAGVAIAMYIHYSLILAGKYGSEGEMYARHDQLKKVEAWMEKKLREKQEARDEISNIKKKNHIQFKKYVLKKQLGKKISRELFNTVQTYLDEYEKALIYWRDKFGYGMPTKEDSRKAAWR